MADFEDEDPTPTTQGQLLDEAIELLHQVRTKLEESCALTSGPNGRDHHFVDGYDVHRLNIGGVAGFIERIERMAKAAKRR